MTEHKLKGKGDKEHERAFPLDRDFLTYVRKTLLDPMLRGFSRS